MDPLFSDFDTGISPENTKDFEEVMNKTLELGNLSAQTVHSPLHLPGLNECRVSESVHHATSLEKFNDSPFFPPPSPVSPDASFLALNFDSKDETEESVNLHEHSSGNTSQVQKRISICYPGQPNPLDQLSCDQEEIHIGDYAEGCSDPKSVGGRGTHAPLSFKNQPAFAREMRAYTTEYANPQMYFAAETTAPVDSCGRFFPEMSSHKKRTTQPLVTKRDFLEYEHPAHELQALLKLLSESIDPPRTKQKTEHRLTYVEEPELNLQTMSKAAPTPEIVHTFAKEVSVKQNTAFVKTPLSNDAWTDLLRTGDSDDKICNPDPGRPPRHIPDSFPGILQPVIVPVTPNSNEEPKLGGMSSPIDEAWFLGQQPITSVNCRSIQHTDLSNGTGLVAPDKKIPNHINNTSDSPAQRCSLVPQPGPQIEILYPSALGNKSPIAVRALLHATGEDIVSKIELYWSHFHDYRVSAEKAKRLLREKSVRFERRKRMGPEVPAIEKKAIRAQRNRERSQALRRYHKQRMGDLEAASGQLKLYNSVARSLINCLLEEPQSLELVKEYFSSHECSEELLMYLRGSH